MSHKKIVARISRIEGQVKGIKRMYEEQRSCLEIIQQIRAAKSALIGLAKELLTEEASNCLQKKEDKEKIKEIIKNVAKL